MCHLSFLKDIDAAAQLIETAEDLTLRNKIYCKSPHALQSLLNSELTQYLFVGGLTSSEVLLLSAPNLHLELGNIPVCFFGHDFNIRKFPASGRIGAAITGLRHSHSNRGSELHLPILWQVAAMPNP